jgi:radical SAM superfamily enzyme YgiQ (UPF0313 family)
MRRGKMTKTVIVTTPIRPIPTEYPPFGSLSIIRAIQKSGNEVDFFDIDSLRPSYEEVLAKLAELKPEILGISAVVSTAYSYVMRLSLDVKKMLPGTVIVLGGNLGASAEILLRKTGIDFIVTSEGEQTIVDLIEAVKSKKKLEDFSQISGILFLDEKSNLINTGYRDPLPCDKLYDVDWEFLKKKSKFDIFFPVATEENILNSGFGHDPRSNNPHLLSKTIGTIVTSKGCVARCTFCHRWDKGYRVIPVDIVISRIIHLQEKYNVGFLIIADENFGSDTKWLKNFCEAIKKLNILWRVSGMRVNRISSDLLQLMKDSGCAVVYFGMETGSKKMLQVMEKKVDIVDNYNAIKMIVDAGLYTTIQLVLGMPGEDNSTIAETIDFVCYAATLSPERSPFSMSINYAQALPGTPLYERAREMGLIGHSIEEEEQYLLHISDKDASDPRFFVNYTDMPTLIVMSWQQQILLVAMSAYIKKFGKILYMNQLLKSGIFGSYINEGKKESHWGYFNYPMSKMPFKKILPLRQGGTNDIKNNVEVLPGILDIMMRGQFGLLLFRYPNFFHNIVGILPLILLIARFKTYGLKKSTKLFCEYVAYYFSFLRLSRKNQSNNLVEYKSLRKITMQNLNIDPNSQDAMIPLRKGR